MRYLLALCILAWVGCSTNPVLEIEELEKEEAPEIDFSYLVYTDGDDDLFLENIATGSKTLLNQPFVDVIDFEVTKSRQDIRFLVNESPYDSVLTYSFSFGRITSRKRAPSSFNGISVAPNGYTYVWHNYPPEIRGLDNNLTLYNGDLDYDELVDVIFYENDRFAYFKKDGSSYYFGYRDVYQGVLNETLVNSKPNTIAKSSNDKIFFITGNSVNNQRLYIAYSSSLGAPQQINVNLQDYYVMDASFHPTDINRVYLLAFNVNNYSDVRLMQLDLTDNNIRTVFKPGEIDRYADKFMLY